MAKEKKKKLTHIDVKDNGIILANKIGDKLNDAANEIKTKAIDNLIKQADKSPRTWQIEQNNRKRAFSNESEQIINNAKKSVKTALKSDNTVNLTEKQASKIYKEVENSMLFLKKDAVAKYQEAVNNTLLTIRSQKALELKDALAKHIESGLNIGVIYKDGKKYQFDTYYEMKARTDIQVDIKDNLIAAGKEAGVIFYITSFYGDCAKDHVDYQGKIYYDENWQSIAPKDRIGEISNYIKQLDADISSFGKAPNASVQAITDGDVKLTSRPNCRHYFMPIGIDEVLGAKTENDVNKLRSERNLNFNGKYKPEKYEALQKQRLNERNIRAEKREIDKLEHELALFPDNYKKLQSEILFRENKVRQYQAEQRSLIKQYNNLERRYDREALGNRVTLGADENGTLEQEKQRKEFRFGSRKIERNNPLYEVNSKIVDSLEYENKIYIKSLSPKANEILAKNVNSILHTNNKSSAEDIFILTPEGEVIRGLKPKFGHEVRRSKEMLDYAADNNNSGYVVVHNHPDSLYPSANDLNGLIETWKNAECGLITCHNGDVWEYRKNPNAKNFDKVSKNEYNEEKIRKVIHVSKDLNRDYFEVLMEIIAEKYNLIIKKR